MKVFISWSGNRSKAVAEILADWIKCVIQATRPWISTRDIDRGALWFSEINDQLKDTSVGIICLTQENVNRPWILFEAGALAKGLSSNRVCTLLVDLKAADVEDPLAQFNHTLPEKDSMWSLVRTLNSSSCANGLDERILEQIFNTYWGQFEQKFNAALKNHPPRTIPMPRPKENVLTEILENTRLMNHRIRRLEADSENDSPDRDIRRMPLSQTRVMIRDMLSRGVDPDIIAKRMERRGIPGDCVKETIVNHIISSQSPDKNESKG